MVSVVVSSVVSFRMNFRGYAMIIVSGMPGFRNYVNTVFHLCRAMFHKRNYSGGSFLIRLRMVEKSTLWKDFVFNCLYSSYNEATATLLNKNGIIAKVFFTNEKQNLNLSSSKNEKN